jgi:hypothetical protein
LIRVFAVAPTDFSIRSPYQITEKAPVIPDPGWNLAHCAENCGKNVAFSGGPVKNLETGGRKRWSRPGKADYTAP